MSIETIIEVKNREQNLKSCSKWIFVLEDNGAVKVDEFGCDLKEKSFPLPKEVSI